LYSDLPEACVNMADALKRAKREGDHDAWRVAPPFQTKPNDPYRRLPQEGILEEALRSTKEEVILEQRPPVKLCVVGGDRELQKALLSYCALAKSRQDLFNQTQVLFYVVPGPTGNALSDYISQHDQWYRHHLAHPFYSSENFLPKAQPPSTMDAVDPNYFDHMERSYSMRRSGQICNATAVSPAQQGGEEAEEPPAAECVTPRAVMAELVHSYLTCAQHTTAVQLFEVQALQVAMGGVDGSDEQLEVSIPMYGAMEVKDLLCNDGNLYVTYMEVDALGHPGPVCALPESPSPAAQDRICRVVITNLSNPDDPSPLPTHPEAPWLMISLYHSLYDREPFKRITVIRAVVRCGTSDRFSATIDGVEHRSLKRMDVSAALVGVEGEGVGWPLRMQVRSFFPIVDENSCAFDPATLRHVKQGHFKVTQSD